MYLSELILYKHAQNKISIRLFTKLNVTNNFVVKSSGQTETTIYKRLRTLNQGKILSRNGGPINT